MAFRTITSTALFTTFLAILPSFVEAQSVLINEIVAESSVPETDVKRPDWIELFNSSSGDVELEGWFLTDSARDITRWRFPAVTLPAKGFLTVLCTGKDLRDPGSKLHTNFQLSRDGEYLALVRPTAEIEDQIAPFFPPLPANVSYGQRQKNDLNELLPPNYEIRYHVPHDSSVQDFWPFRDFDDSSWSRGNGGVGFDFNGEKNLLTLVTTDVRDDMHSVNASIYLRTSFEVEDLEKIDSAILKVHYEDGFVAFLNGVEVARKHAPEILEFNSRATTSPGDEDVLRGEDFLIDAHHDVLRNGRNVLAIQGLNSSVGSRDFVLRAGIEAFKIVEHDVRVLEYFEEPSPDGPNGSGFPGIARSIQANQESRLIHEPLEIELLSPDGGEIRYTLNGGPPDRESKLYTGRIIIDRSIRVRARAFVPDLVPGPTTTFAFPMMDASTREFDSNLPLLVIETFGTTILKEPKIPGYLHVVDVDANTGRSNLIRNAQFFGPIGIERRGSTTGARTKASYSLETRDIFSEDLDVALLGMPADSDWVLYGPLDFDRALIRNSFAYALSNQIGLYAVRTQFVEIFVNLDASRIERSNDYYGVYVFMEKIKRGPHRVNVEPLPLTAREEPEISGGYILKRDRAGPNDVGLGDNLQHVYPREEDIPAHQATWLKRYLAQLNRSIGSPGKGYTRFFDVDSTVDFHLLREFIKSQDAFIVSTYFYKPRGKPIHWGPVWDFDRTLGSLGADGSIVNPEGWSLVRLANWWGHFFNDPAFVARYKQRWEELRTREFSLQRMNALIDSLTAQITEAQVRNFDRWTGLINPEGGWEAEIQKIKNWIKKRVAWMDIQLIGRSGSQLPGDSNQDGHFNIADALHLVTVLIRPEGALLACDNGRPTDAKNLSVLDTNADFKLDISDIIYNLMYLFLDGPPPSQGTECMRIPDCPDVCGK